MGHGNIQQLGRYLQSTIFGSQQNDFKLPAHSGQIGSFAAEQSDSAKDVAWQRYLVSQTFRLAESLRKTRENHPTHPSVHNLPSSAASNAQDFIIKIENQVNLNTDNNLDQAELKAYIQQQLQIEPAKLEEQTQKLAHAQTELDQFLSKHSGVAFPEIPNNPKRPLPQKKPSDQSDEDRRAEEYSNKFHARQHEANMLRRLKENIGLLHAAEVSLSQ